MISSAHASSSPGHDGRPTQPDEMDSPPLVLEICCGQTRFPLRPVWSNRFLIGAGAGCDLRLGGDDMPPLHSIVQVDGVDPVLETVTLTPPLKVNGLAVESVVLQDGDRISIGPFELVAHRPYSAATTSTHETLPLHEAVLLDHLEDDVADPSDLSQRSAAELIELIEEEEELVHQFDERRQLGAEALLDAVAERIEAASAGEQPQELVLLLEQAGALADELKQRTGRLADREVAQAQLTEAVFESQQQLAKRLESLVSRIAELEDRRFPRYPKVA